jgi:FdhD protein
MERISAPPPRPLMTDAGLCPCHPVEVVDEHGQMQATHIAGERPLTLYVDKREIVTLMTLGTHPELLTIGYLRNQGLVQDLTQLRSVQVDWETDSVAVTTVDGIDNLDERLSRRTVTTGCGQGTVFGRLLDHLGEVKLAPAPIRQSQVYALLGRLADQNEVYRQAGAVHGCALCHAGEIEIFVEDVGRHNAVDAIAAHMWLEGIAGQDKVFYTTGRLTSEMVIKVAQMRIPVLLSRSGVTRMGLDIARLVGVTMIARAKGRHFLIFNGAEHVLLDATPVEHVSRERAHRADGHASGAELA